MVSPLVTTSTTEAEFLGASLSIREVETIYMTLTELGIMITTCVVYTDNQGSIKIMQSQSSSGRAKHLDIRLQYIKQLINKGKYKIRYCSTKDNVADIFTKSLARIDFERLVSKMMYKNV